MANTTKREDHAEKPKLCTDIKDGKHNLHESVDEKGKVILSCRHCSFVDTK